MLGSAAEFECSHERTSDCKRLEVSSLQQNLDSIDGTFRVRVRLFSDRRKKIDRDRGTLILRIVLAALKHY